MLLSINNHNGWSTFSKKQKDKSIAIHSIMHPSIVLSLTIKPQGIVCKLNKHGPFDLDITIRHSIAVGVLFKLPIKEMSDKSMVKINGDLNLAESLSNLNLDIEDSFRKKLQKIVGIELASIAITIFNDVRKSIIDHSSQVAVDFISSYLPNQNEAYDFYNNIRKLSNRTQELANKIK